MAKKIKRNTKSLEEFPLRERLQPLEQLEAVNNKTDESILKKLPDFEKRLKNYARAYGLSDAEIELVSSVLQGTLFEYHYARRAYSKGALKNRVSHEMFDRITAVILRLEELSDLGLIDTSDLRTTKKTLKELRRVEDEIDALLSQYHSGKQFSHKPIYKAHAVAIDVFKAHSDQIEPIYTLVHELHSALFGNWVRHGRDSLKTEYLKLKKRESKK